MRRTGALLQVAVALLEHRGERQWGYELGQRAELRSGVLYPILHRLLEQGWLRDGWEEQEDGPRRRPARRYYEVTELGERELVALLGAAPAARPARTAPVPRLGGAW